MSGPLIYKKGLLKTGGIQIDSIIANACIALSGGKLNVNIPTNLPVGSLIFVAVQMNITATGVTEVVHSDSGPGWIWLAGAQRHTGPRVAYLYKPAAQGGGLDDLYLQMSGTLAVTSFVTGCTVKGCNIGKGLAANGVNSIPNPPYITSDWGVRQHIWIAHVYTRTDNDFVVFSEGYDLLVEYPNNRGHMITKISVADSEDPGPWQLASDRYVLGTSCFTFV